MTNELRVVVNGYAYNIHVSHSEGPRGWYAEIGGCRLIVGCSSPEEAEAKALAYVRGVEGVRR